MVLSCFFFFLVLSKLLSLLEFMFMLNEMGRVIFLYIVILLLCYLGKYLNTFGSTGGKLYIVVILSDRILSLRREQLLQPPLFFWYFYSS